MRNNPEKLPQGYIFQLENQEFKDLRSKFFSASVTFCYFCVIIMNKEKWRIRHFGNGCMRPTSGG
ncbi:MAG: hypothetical protein J6T87_07215 [Bacteroidales bacterium]|nr:hypothetical protein [Bacteroidales bacterium]